MVKERKASKNTPVNVVAAVSVPAASKSHIRPATFTATAGPYSSTLRFGTPITDVTLAGNWDGAILPSARSAYAKELCGMEPATGGKILTSWIQRFPDHSQTDGKHVALLDAANVERQRLSRLAWAVIQAAADGEESRSGEELHFSVRDLERWASKTLARPAWLNDGAPASEAWDYLVASMCLRDMLPQERIAMSPDNPSPWDVSSSFFPPFGVEFPAPKVFVLGAACPSEPTSGRALPAMFAPVNSRVGARPHVSYQPPFGSQFRQKLDESFRDQGQTRRAVISLRRLLRSEIDDASLVCVLRVRDVYVLFPFGTSRLTWQRIVGNPRCVELLQLVDYVYATEYAESPEQILPDFAANVIGKVSYIGHLKASAHPDFVAPPGDELVLVSEGTRKSFGSFVLSWKQPIKGEKDG